jgi:hypothetical protein
MYHKQHDFFFGSLQKDLAKMLLHKTEQNLNKKIL